MEEITKKGENIYEKNTIQDMLAVALRSEYDSEDVYNALAGRTKNFVLKDMLKFLAGEEKKHSEFILNIANALYPGMDIENAVVSMIPLPRVDINQKNLSDILAQAMEAELAAEKFYMAMAEKMEKESHVRIMEYLARMEWRHYHMLKSEMETMKTMEDSMEYNELMHVGP